MGYYALADGARRAAPVPGVVDALAPAVAEFRRAAARTRRPTSASCCRTSGLPIRSLATSTRRSGPSTRRIGSRRTTRRSPAYLDPGAPLGEKVRHRPRAGAESARRSRRTICGSRVSKRRRFAQTGKADEAVSLLQEFIKKQADRPEPYVALAQLYSDTKRGGDAVRVLQEAQSKFPTDTMIPFELGATFDKQKRFADAESAFRQVLSREPDHAQALNYLGYMLADRGERLDESVDLLKKALAVEPDNGSYLDSLGWAYYKADKLDLAVDQPAARRRTAPGQLRHSGPLRRRALQARRASTMRSPPGSARLAATATRSIAPRSTRRSARQSKSSARNDATRGGAGADAVRGVRVVRQAAAEAAGGSGQSSARCDGHRPRAPRPPAGRWMPISLEMSVSGSIAGGRVRGRLLAGLTRAGAVRLEAVAPVGQPVFILTNGVGSVPAGATLLLPRDNRVLERGRFDAVLASGDRHSARRAAAVFSPDRLRAVVSRGRKSARRRLAHRGRRSARGLPASREGRFVATGGNADSRRGFGLACRVRRLRGWIASQHSVGERSAASVRSEDGLVAGGIEPDARRRGLPHPDPGVGRTDRASTS